MAASIWYLPAAEAIAEDAAGRYEMLKERLMAAH
jgi:hypothetical protein